MPIDVRKWESIIQTIVDESIRKPNAARKSNLLVEWRAKLEKEPPFLKPYEIDEIVREVRRRLGMH